MSGTSRAKRFDAAKGDIEGAITECEALREELQEWLSNMPENLQSGEKACQLEEAISNLDDVISNLEEAANIEVEFPGMY